MSIEEVDNYIAAQDEAHAQQLQDLRRMVLKILPKSEQGISYGAPVFRIDGKPIVGLFVAKNHISFLPHSGGILPNLTDEELGGLNRTKSALHLPLGAKAPAKLIRRLIQLRRAEAGV